MYYLTTDIGEAKIYIWHIEESESQLREMLGAVAPEWVWVEACSMKSEKRRMERLAARLLLYELGISPADLIYAPNGAPRFAKGNKHISIAGSGGFVVIALSNSPVGIDLETQAERAHRLRRRFVTDNEELFPSQQNAMGSLRFWTAKEAVFKLHNEHLTVISQVELLSCSDTKAYSAPPNAARISFMSQPDFLIALAVVN